MKSEKRKKEDISWLQVDSSDTKPNKLLFNGDLRVEGKKRERLKGKRGV